MTSTFKFSVGDKVTSNLPRYKGMQAEVWRLPQSSYIDSTYGLKILKEFKADDRVVWEAGASVYFTEPELEDLITREEGQEIEAQHVRIGDTVRTFHPVSDLGYSTIREGVISSVENNSEGIFLHTMGKYDAIIYSTLWETVRLELVKAENRSDKVKNAKAGDKFTWVGANEDDSFTLTKFNDTAWVYESFNLGKVKGTSIRTQSEAEIVFNFHEGAEFIEA